VQTMTMMRMMIPGCVSEGTPPLSNGPGPGDTTGEPHGTPRPNFNYTLTACESNFDQAVNPVTGHIQDPCRRLSGP